ncbi:UTP--glucose-1-phosphate uridylyltransferase [subsurface metagenome]|nr:NDP-sugar synthase [Clostridia bacterium]TET15090.1 MAG: NDP-sugar synthase [Actinomycetota bacterium]
MKAVILVGGEGTRLRPITFLNPKSMLPLINKPFMENFIFWLKSHRIKDIIFSTGHLLEIFNNYFGDGSKFGLKLTYVNEEKPLDTCGGVKNVEKYLGGDRFMVFNGDILSSLDLTDMIVFHKRKKADITISLTPVEDPTSYGLVPIDNEGKVKQFIEKPGQKEITTNLINAGIYIIEPYVMKLAPEGKNYSFERGLFPRALYEGYKIYGYVSDSYWLDVGTPQKYLKAHYDILNKKVNFKFPYKELMENIYIGKGSRYLKNNFVCGPLVIGERTEIEKGAKIMPLTVIGNDCFISGGTEISESIIFNNCKIGKNCLIKKSIISNNVVIYDNVSVEGYSVIGDNSRIEKNNVLKDGIKINVNSNIPEGQITF